MLSIGAMSGGQGAYYSGLAREDYYLAGGEPPGEWLGDGAQKLGLTGAVQRDEFLELFDGFHDGEALVQSAGKEKHRPGWDLTFSAPKSVSVAWSQADAETALEIRAAQLSAVEAAIQYIQENAVWTRRGKGGSELERCAVLVPTFEHGTSRAQDPQLHTHALLLNIGVRADGSTGTLETQSLYDHKMAAGAVYRAELARQLERCLGFMAERKGSWFELCGVSEKLVDEFSTRRKEIEEKLAEKGLKSARAAEFAALDTREMKAHIGRAELSERWRAVGKEHGWSTPELSSLVRGPQLERNAERELQDACARAHQKLTEKNSYFRERDMVRFVAEEAQTMAAGAEAVLKTVKDHMAASPEIVRLGMRHGEVVFTTQEMLSVERQLMAQVQASRERGGHRVTDENLQAVLKDRASIKEEQAHALRHITQGQGSMASVTGMAGTGKTFLLEAAHAAWQRGGRRVLGAAISGKAAQGLEEGTAIQSFTIAGLLKRLEGKSESLDENTVLVIDEAGMVGTRQMKKLVDACGSAGAKLVLVGDEKQLQAIEAGGAFATISRELGTATLSDIVRQRETWQRESVKDFAFGNAREALAAYAERGLVSVAPDKKGAQTKLLAAWEKSGLAQPKENLIVAATNLEAVTLNRKIQEARAREGFLKTAAVEISGERFHEGDRMLFTRNSGSLGVKNGTLATVAGVNERLGQVTVQLDNGERRQFSAQHYEDVRLGYAVTTHKAQGMTAENVFILTSETMQDRELSYVQASRGKGETRFFTTESEAGEQLSQLAKRMEKSHQKEMAVEVKVEIER